MRFQSGNVHESASLFNLKEKEELVRKTVAHYRDGPVYYANHQTTEDLLDKINPKKNLNSF